MVAELNHDIVSIASNFQLDADLVGAAPHGTGHIHETFVATCVRAEQQQRYILQRINHHVFRNPPAVMQNIIRVTAHIREKLCTSGVAEVSRRVLEVIPAQDGKPFCRDDQGNYWRAYTFIENAITRDVVNSDELAFQAAKAFGVFQNALVDLPPPRLADTIPDFHHTPQRFAALERAVEEDVCNRATDAHEEIDSIRRHSGMIETLLQLCEEGQIPERVIHNDTKVNNVMIDGQTGEGICVIDLDTVMPGLVLYDFGDLVRSTSSPTPEDERDLSRVRVRMQIFEALARGYLREASSFLRKAEKDYLVFSGQLITLEIGIRFLTDYLSGDTYFRIHRPGQNLDRCRAQLKLFKELRRKEECMQQVIERVNRG